MFGPFSFIDKTFKTTVPPTDKTNDGAFFGPAADTGSGNNGTLEKQANEISGGAAPSSSANTFFKPSVNQIQRKPKDAPVPVAPAAPITGKQPRRDNYDVDEDSGKQEKSSGTKPNGDTQLSYDESSSTFSLTFTMVWLFPHVWDNTKREDFVLGFEKTVRDAWDDRFLLEEKGTKRKAHVKLSFNHNLTYQGDNPTQESYKYNQLLYSTKGWGMDASDPTVRSKVKGSNVELSENANKKRLVKGADLAARAKVLVDGEGENQNYMFTASPHEFGHMMGLGDEYIQDDDTETTNLSVARSHINNRIMNVGDMVTKDDYAPFADWLAGLTQTAWMVGKKLR